MSAPEDFRAAMRATGLDYAGPIVADGKLYRIKAEGDKACNSWYVLHVGPPAAGAFGCWKRGLKEKWCGGNGKMSPAERTAARRLQQEAERERDRAQAECHAAARKTADRILLHATPAKTHPYLDRKGAAAFGDVREYHGALVLPLRDVEGTLHGLQFISRDGEKRFLRGGRVAGCFFALAQNPYGPLVIVEGYATGASVHEATGMATVCAMNCGSLMTVAEALRAKSPERDIIVAADDDQWTDGNPGITKATAAAKAIQARLAFPQFKDLTTKPTDFNDLNALDGLATVKAQIESATTPKETTDDIINRLAELPPAEYDQCRKAEAEKLGLRVGTLDAEVANRTAKDKEPSAEDPTAADLLVALVADVPLFLDDEGTAYAEVPKPQGGVEVLRVRSGRFSEWLAAAYHRAYHGVAKRTVIDDARAVISGEAELRGIVLPVHIRIGAHEGCIVLDLGDSQRRAVIIQPGRWEIVANPSVKFLRPSKALPLPDPKSGGDFSALWKILNVRARDRVLCVGWLLSSLQPTGPFFLINFVGEQGTGKSLACRFMRMIVDPSSVPLRRGTTEERSLWVAAANNRVLAFENLSSLPAWLSDALCALATGGGYSSRQLYTDNEEAAFTAQRPVLLNGIADVVARPDLAERTLRVELEIISKTNRRTESELNAEFARVAPDVLGALMDAAAYGLSRLPTLKLDSLPRMADAARWIEACLPRLRFKEGDFLRALDRHERETADSAIDGSAIARAVVALMAEAQVQDEWTGPAGLLLELLAQKIPESDQHRREWPANPRALSGALRRMAPALRRVGIEVHEPRPGDKRREWRLVKRGVPELPPEPPTPPDGPSVLGLSSGGSHVATALPPNRPPDPEAAWNGLLGGLGGLGGSPEPLVHEADEEVLL